MSADNKRNLLVELFVEELPPKVLKKLGDAFAGVLRDQLVLQGLAEAASTLTAYASPRRLAAHLTQVAAVAADKAVSQKLMPVAVGIDAAGNATPALLKRLAALGADASAVAGLKRAVDGKAEALFYESTAKGASLAEGLQKALAEAIAKLPIPKVMSYQLEEGSAMPGWTSVSFVRPAHGLVALHGADVVAVEALGLKSGRDTHGHRFEASVDPVVLRDADSYVRQLADEGAVIAGFDQRRAEIERQLAAAAVKVGSDSVPIDDDALLDEVTALVERPNVLVCSFEPEFLDVPQECLILTMKANQKYFPLLDGAGKLTNKFLVVSNISPDDTSAVVQGNERVIRPRLADAKFFFDQDRKKSLAIGGRRRRRPLQAALRRRHFAAWRCGRGVALADKLETLVGMFGIGNLPTGDRDPFALRRHALGVGRMLVERALPLHFYELTRLAFAAFKPGLLEDRSVELDQFIIERLKGYFRDEGYTAVEVDAALHAHKLGEWSTIPARLAAVRSFAALPEAPALAAANKRIGNILKKAPDADAHVSELLLQEPAEKALYAAMANVVPAANAQFDAGDYTASLQTLAALRAPVDAFFDGVMVNAEQADLRLNRLGLLKSLHEAMNRVAQLERLAA